MPKIISTSANKILQDLATLGRGVVGGRDMGVKRKRRKRRRRGVARLEE